jgi:hypothetical protein
MRPMQRVISFCFAVLALSWMCTLTDLIAADADVCAICGRPFVDIYYSIEDKVTLQKKHVCKECERTLQDCFVCGLPAGTNEAGFVQLPDRRVLCSRDARTAVLHEEEGVRICKEVHESLDRLFSRFTSFPDDNVTIEVMDRVSLQDIFKLLGNDYHCPNVWGMTQTETNRGHLQFRISLMTGLPLSWFQATCAHEFGHTWVAEHLSPERKARLDRDSEEGFCELVAFLFMESLHDHAQQALIQRNAYTRGQIDLFIDSCRSYGINEVLDWVQFGADGRLSAADPEAVRKLALHPPSAHPALSLGRIETKVPPGNELILRGIIWDKTRPLVIINDHTLGQNEAARLQLGSSNLLVRCVSITRDSVRLSFPELDKERILRLK